MPSLFLLPKHELYYELAGSTFSEQISYLSFPEFSIGVAGSNRFAHDSPSVRNIKFSAVNLHSLAAASAGDLSFHGYKIGLYPVWTKFNYIAHRTLNSGYELRQCLVSKVVGLFANLSSHLHSSWRQITYFELICSPIGRNPNGSIKAAHPKSRTRTVSQGPFTRLIKSLEINSPFD